MNPRVARWAGTTMLATLAFSILLFAVLTSGKVLVSQRGALGGSLVRAEFHNAWPLVPGMTVRISGAVAGSVEDVALTDHGTAMVGLRLARGVPFPRMDATAAIRQQDVLGDSYVALTLGRSAQSLKGSIPMARTVAMPRLDDLFSTFRAPVRAGLQTLITEMALAMDRRGADLNHLLLQLRPGLEAADAALREVDGQRGTLRQVVTDAEQLTSRLANRSDELTGSLAELRRLTAATEAHAPALARTLSAAPATMRAARTTLDRTSAVTAKAVPLTKKLARAAPQLRAVADMLGPFTDDASASLTSISPLLATLRTTLQAAEPLNRLLPTLDPVDVLLPASGVLQVLSPIFGDGAKALFGASTYGADPRGQTGLGAVAVERGDQPATPKEDPRRMWLRTGIVLSCESFGRPIKPGCLTDLLAGDKTLPTVKATALTASSTSDSAGVRAALRSPVVAQVLKRVGGDKAQNQLLDYLLK